MELPAANLRFDAGLFSGHGRRFLALPHCHRPKNEHLWLNAVPRTGPIGVDRNLEFGVPLAAILDRTADSDVGRLRRIPPRICRRAGTPRTFSLVDAAATAEQSRLGRRAENGTG